MGREKRRSLRIEISLPIRLMVRGGEEDAILAMGDGRISDISRHGLRLTAPQAKIGQWHLFYSFHQGAEEDLRLEACSNCESAEDLPDFRLPMRPVWFDRLLTHPDKPFQLGMEFLAPPQQEVIDWLNQQMEALEHQQIDKGLWSRLRALFGSR